jgi:Zn-dependent protease
VFRHTIPIGRVFGILIELDYSWFLVFGLFTWIFAVSYYPSQFKNWSVAEYWFMGAVTAVMLFVSVLLHELGHSVVAMHYKIPVRRITFFVFGGVSQIAAEPPSAGIEFLIAIAGPAVSIALAIILWELQPLVVHAGALPALTKYLALLNLVLGIFNLLPGFPLDGGRIFRAILWAVTRNFQRAAAIAAATGRFFGFVFIFLGVWQVFAGNVFNGIWIAFIGWFLESAAASQSQQQALRDLLAGHRVSEMMNREYVRVPGELTLQELIDKHVLTGGRRCFVVSRGEETVGLLTLSEIKKVPRSSWPTTTVAQVSIPMDKLITAQPDTGAWTILEKMGRDGINQIPVVDDGKIVGMFGRDDLIHYLAILEALRA